MSTSSRPRAQAVQASFLRGAIATANLRATASLFAGEGFAYDQGPGSLLFTTPLPPWRCGLLLFTTSIAPFNHYGRRTGCARPHPRPRDGGSRPMPDLNGVTRFLLERGGRLSPGRSSTAPDERSPAFPAESQPPRPEAGGSGYLIKQPGDPAAGGAETVRREAEFLDFCSHEPAAAEAVRFLPRLACYDDAAVVLVQELVADTVPLWPCYQALNRRISTGSPGAGTALGTVHRVFRWPGLAEADGLSRLPSGEPWAVVP